MWIHDELIRLSNFTRVPTGCDLLRDRPSGNASGSIPASSTAILIIHPSGCGWPVVSTVRGWWIHGFRGRIPVSRINGDRLIESGVGIHPSEDAMSTVHLVTSGGRSARCCGVVLASAVWKENSISDVFVDHSLVDSSPDASTSALIGPAAEAVSTTITARRFDHLPSRVSARR